MKREAKQGRKAKPCFEDETSGTKHVTKYDLCHFFRNDTDLSLDQENSPLMKKND